MSFAQNDSKTHQGADLFSLQALNDSLSAIQGPTNVEINLRVGDNLSSQNLNTSMNKSRKNRSKSNRSTKLKKQRSKLHSQTRDALSRVMSPNVGAAGNSTLSLEDNLRN